MAAPPVEPTRSVLIPIVACAWVFAALVSPSAVLAIDSTVDSDAVSRDDPSETVVEKGLRVEFAVEPLRRTAGPLIAGEHAEVRFAVTDAATGAPVSPLEPAVWVSRTLGTENLPCRERIGRYLQGLISFQADVDLNKYFILIMNHDRTIAVVDPLLGISGITQLYAMIQLDERGEDWARNTDDTLMFVTMPAANRVAVVDLESFEVLDVVDAGTNPVRIEAQPDGRYLWVGNDGDNETSGVTVIDTLTREVVAQIPTGSGHHEVAFSDDSLFAFVTNGSAGTVSIVDVQRLTKITDVDVGESPLAVGFSNLAGTAYVAAADGTLTVLDGSEGTVLGRTRIDGGIRAFRFDPSGRWGFVAHATRTRVDVVDTSRGAVVHSVPVGAGPREFAFTDTYAYVRHSGTASVTLIPLAQLDRSGTLAIQHVDFGTEPPGGYNDPAAADAIAPTGEWTAVVAANPLDKTVYYYMEGMIAPMGSYSTYGRVPRGVAVVDRSVREKGEGVYAASFRVPQSGHYSVAFLLDSPVVDHCFEFTAEPDPRAVSRNGAGTVAVDFLAGDRRVAAGRSHSIRFVVTRSGRPVAGLEDVTVLSTRPPGSWQERLAARPIGDGVYEADLTFDETGVYFVSVAVPSLGVDFTALPNTSLFAVDASPDTRAEAGR